MQNLQSTVIYNAVPPGAIKDDASFTPVVIDTIHAGTVQFLITLGATDIAMAALKVQECDTSDGSYTDITGADFSVSPATLPGAGSDNGVYLVDILKSGGRKRYMQLIATAGNGSAGTYLSAVAILDRVDNGPSTAAERGATQALIVL